MDAYWKIIGRPLTPPRDPRASTRDPWTPMGASVGVHRFPGETKRGPSPQHPTGDQWVSMRIIWTRMGSQLESVDANGTPREPLRRPSTPMGGHERPI